MDAEQGTDPDRTVTTVRLVADLPTPEAERLAAIAARSGHNRTTTLIRAIRLLELVDAEEGPVVVEGPDGTRCQVVLP